MHAIVRWHQKKYDVNVCKQETSLFTRHLGWNLLKADWPVNLLLPFVHNWILLIYEFADFLVQGSLLAEASFPYSDVSRYVTNCY